MEVVHNVKDGGVQVTTLEEFSAGKPVFIQGVPKSFQHIEIILAQAGANIGKPYSLFSQNCEHFCTFCYEGKQRSESVAGVAAIVGAVAVAAFIFAD